MSTILAIRSFSHGLSTIANIWPNLITSVDATYITIDSDTFSYIGTNWYSFDKFYGIMFDTGISKLLVLTNKSMY